MKNTIFKKFLAGLLATTCVLGLLSGCGNTNNEATKESSTKKETAEVSYPLEGETTLTLAMVDSGAVTSLHGGSYKETPFIKALEEATGVTLEIDAYADDASLNLMIASGELPDIILFNNANAYSGGIAKAIVDGVVQPLNDYAEYCPDLMETLNSKETYTKAATTSDGHIIGFPTIRGDDYLLTSCGMIIRQDYLDQLKMERPQTADEFYEALKAFKEELNVEAPFSPTFDYLFWFGIYEGLMTSPFGLPRGDFYVDNGEVHYGYNEKTYKDVLVYLKKLYDEGLLDSNFATTNTATARANFMNGVSGACIDSPGGGMGGFLTTMADDPTFDCSGIGPLVAKAGDIPMSTHYGSALSGAYMVITTTCKNKEAAAQFLNYAYTEEGHMLYNFGIEGVSYEMINGYPTYTDLIMNNPDGLTKQQAMGGYLRAWTTDGYVQDKRYMEQYSNAPQQQQALSQWTKSDAAKYQYPNVSVADADSAEYSKIMGDIETYTAEMAIRYITGDADLATFESEYLKTMESMGINRVLEMKQAAYDAYNAR